ncbi:cytochrome b [Rhizobium sp. TRM95796]|uniref:cytochrome b n=1 Tax=Rhizobium sp. TRM95796 TaxID=2979862 RepID=UPI0021E73DA2|nr:cytochrome b/b6 domain-containing protein [Rhizobium sp. TRM95796]MCV3768711.1 cytochrome b/b6 domain-containing protein [Rhizobium sp. TRM95796]
MQRAYSLIQIALHWIIVAMIPVQYLTGGSVERTHHAAHMGMEPDPWDMLQHLVHNYCGIAIGFLMGLRLLVRLRGAPEETPKSLASLAARALHLAFYAAIIGQASLGFIASYLTFSVAPLHVAGSWVILGMVALHLAAAAWHTLVLRDGTLDCMTRLPGKTTAE